MKEEAQLLTQACGEKAHKIIVRYHIEFDPVVRPQIFRKSTTVKSFAEAVGDTSLSLSRFDSRSLSLSFLRSNIPQVYYRLALPLSFPLPLPLPLFLQERHRRS